VADKPGMLDDCPGTEDKRVIQCNLREPTKVFARGARAYVVLANPGNAHDRITILGRSRRGKWVEKWEPIKRLDNFRAKPLPPEHPLHRSRRVWADVEVDSICAKLQAAASKNPS
jgi:hypothetical protein